MDFWKLFRQLNCFCGSESVTLGDRKFIIRDKLGEGGFATIDLIEDKATKRLYALKKIACHSSDDEKEALKEVSYMRDFKHPNLVPCETHALVPKSQKYEGGGHNILSTAISDVLIVMPYYKRGALSDELERLKMSSLCMNEERILDLLYGICDGLDYLHSLKPVSIAHRDVKPHNVMFYLDDSLREIPVLVDFGSMGSARCVINNSSDGHKLQDFAAEKCSMPYRAPELFQVEIDSIVDEKVDVWSLGCTLYAMCFHESPFDRVHQRGDSVALAVMAAKIKIPDNHRYSQALIELTTGLLKVDPRERPSARDIMSQVVRLKPDVRML